VQELAEVHATADNVDQNRKRAMTEGTESLEALEQRVAGLIDRYRGAQQRVQELEREAAERARECERLGAEAEQLRGRTQELEQQLSDSSGREELVRNKLQQIVSQIDGLESEIAGMNAGGDESEQAD
jgi:chromosome segregation ATPase